MTDTGLTGEAPELLLIGKIVDRRVHGLCPMPRRITKAPKRAIEPSATPPTVPSYLTSAEAAQRLRVCVRTIARLHSEGKLIGYSIGVGGPRRFRADDIERLLVPDQLGVQQDADLDSFISTHTKKG